MRRAPLWIALVIGIGLALAPAAFQMFGRAPGGARMLADFQPYMKTSVLDNFQGYLDKADGAARELRSRGPALAAARLRIDSRSYDARFASVRDFDRTMPATHDDMSGLLRTIRGNIGNYEAVKALPSFKLFPWFFVLPGVFIAIAAAVGLRRTGKGRRPGGARVALGVLGVGLIAAPLMFQMFARAPHGAKMLDEFAPIMTTPRITQVQTYFLQMGSGEAAIRNQLLPQLRAAGLDDAQLRHDLPATMAFEGIWTKMANQMAPMLGAMNDNLGRFHGLRALPPFTLFPWFFVIPGVLLVGLAVAVGRRSALDPFDGPDPTVPQQAEPAPALTKEKQ